MFGDRQSVSAVHAALHAVVPLHMYGAHEIVLAAWQVPVPLQVRPEVSVDEVAGHDGAAQEALASYWLHAPAPLQNPFVPHEAAP
jgi:hypothetical protein